MMNTGSRRGNKLVKRANDIVARWPIATNDEKNELDAIRTQLEKMEIDVASVIIAPPH